MKTIQKVDLNNADFFNTAADDVAVKPADSIEQVKREIFTEYQSALGANEQLLRLALIEADAVARQTDYPGLIFPLLAAEKAENAARWQFRQRFLLRSNSPHALAA
jgi:hypothetical protein